MDLSIFKDYWPYFNYGVLVTIFISICVVFLGTILGVILAFAQRTKFPPLVWLANFYIWIFRGTPMLVQIMVSFTLLSIEAPIIDFGAIKLDMTRIIPGVLVISMNSGAYISEIVRAGLNAVPKGQTEASYSLGMRPSATMRYVVMPQAVKNILPALGNEFITIIKDSSLLQTIGVMELWNGANTVGTGTYQTLPSYLVAAAYYLLVTTVLTLLMKKVEKRLNKGEVKA